VACPAVLLPKQEIEPTYGGAYVLTVRYGRDEDGKFHFEWDDWEIAVAVGDSMQDLMHDFPEYPKTLTVRDGHIEPC